MQQLPEFWQRHANKAYHQGYNGESRLWNPYNDDNHNRIPDWIEQAPQSVRVQLFTAFRSGQTDREQGNGRNEPYETAALEMPESNIRLAHAESTEPVTSGLPSEVDAKPKNSTQSVIV